MIDNKTYQLNQDQAELVMITCLGAIEDILPLATGDPRVETALDAYKCVLDTLKQQGLKAE